MKSPLSILFSRWTLRRRQVGMDSESSPERFANVKAAGPGGETSFVAGPDRHIVISVDIGALDPASDVVEPSPFPDRLLPLEDLQIRVLLSSAALAVGIEKPGDCAERPTAAEQTLTLPRGGGGSISEDGSGGLRFVLALPEEAVPTRARLSYLYRDTVVQSQRLDLLPNYDSFQPGAMKLEVRTDFTLSTSLDQKLNEIADRPRVSVVANANSAGVHELTVRGPDGSSETIAFNFRPEVLTTPVRELRERLGQRAPTQRKRSVKDLEHDLRLLAPIGYELFSLFDEDALERLDETSLIQVAVTDGSGFTLPWNLLYDIALEDGAELTVCPVVAELGGDEGAVAADRGECPHGGEDWHIENVLCPFGFWGFKKSFEILATSEEPPAPIEVTDDAQVLIAETERGMKSDQLSEHIQHLRECFKGRSPTIRVEEAKTKLDVKKMICTDMPFLYFLCHGDRKGRTTLLGVGKNELIAPSEFKGWARNERIKNKRRVWTQPRPLVFINACESTAVAPEDLVGYLSAFVGSARAVGLIGTEVRVSQTLAMEVGEEFFEKLLHGNKTVGEALAEIRSGFLRSRNLFGLVYTSYCLADLRVG